MQPNGSEKKKSGGDEAQARQRPSRRQLAAKAGTNPEIPIAETKESQQKSRTGKDGSNPSGEGQSQGKSGQPQQNGKTSRTDPDRVTKQQKAKAGKSDAHESIDKRGRSRGSVPKPKPKSKTTSVAAEKKSPTNDSGERLKKTRSPNTKSTATKPPASHLNSASRVAVPSFLQQSPSLPSPVSKMIIKRKRSMLAPQISPRCP
jgi:hypothetical protein